MAQVVILSGGIEQDTWFPRIRRSLGPYRLCSALLKAGYTATVIDYIQYMSLEELKRAMSKVVGEDTLWVGYSSTFFLSKKVGKGLTHLEKMYQNTDYDRICEVYDFIQNKSKAKIVFGGAYALFPPADPRVDFYLSGYADNTVVNLTDYLAGKDKLNHFTEIDINGIKSISVKGADYPEPAMDSLHTFWHEKCFNLLPKEPVPLEFARGCIFKCKFCNYPLIGKKKGTYIRDMEQVRDEMIELWEVNGTDTFYITDDTFNDDNDKMEEFHKVFTSLPFKPKFSAFLRLDLINRFPDQADLLMESGLVGTFFGVETFNKKSGVAIGKGLDPEKSKKRLQWVCDKWKGKVNVALGLIIGLPYDNERYFQELFDYLHSPDYPAQHTVINPLHIFDKSKGVNLYGSEFSMNSEVYGYKFDDKGLWYHEEQKLNFTMCHQIASAITNSISHKQMLGEFNVVTYLGMGIPMEDILTLTMEQIHQKHNIEQINIEKINQYKTMVGAI